MPWKVIPAKVIPTQATHLITLALLLVGCGSGDTPDTQVPGISLGSLPTSVTAAGPLTLNATATDNVGVTKVAFYDGDQKLGEDDSVPYAYTVSLSAAQNGPHSYSARAYDKAGNEGKSATHTVQVSITAPDTQAPSVSLGNLPASITAAGPLTLNATATDNVGITKVAFYDGDQKLGEDMTAPYVLSVPISYTENGDHQYSARAYDAAGNEGRSASVALRVAITIPGPGVPGQGSGDRLYESRQVTLKLPAAFLGQTLTLDSPFGSQTVLAGLPVQVTTMPGLTPLLTVQNAAGQPLLASWLLRDGSAPTAATTAAVLVYYALGLWQLPDPQQKDLLRTELQHWPQLSGLTKAIQDTLNAGRELTDPAVAQALQEALKNLAGPAAQGKMQALAMTVNPSGTQSGIDTNLGSNNTLWFTNNYMRPAKAVIEREYYLDSAGRKVAAYQANSVSLEIPGITKFSGTLDTATQYFALPPDQRGTVGGLLPQSSEKIMLPNMPGARRTVYTAYVYGPGLLPGEESKLTAAMQSDFVGMSVRFFMDDIFFPYLTDMAGSLVGKLGDSPETSAMIEKFTSTALALTPTVVPLIKKGNYQEALLEITTAVLTNSDLQDEFLRVVFLHYLMESKRKGEGGFGAAFDPVLTANSGEAFNRFKSMTGALSGVKNILGNRFIELTDKALKGANIAALIGSVSASERAYTQTLTVIDPKVILSTDLKEPDVTHPAQLAAKLADQDAALNEDGQLVYRWSLSSGDPALGYLHLQSDGRELKPGQSSGDSSSAQATFQPLGIDGTVTVTAEMYQKNARTKELIYLGKDSQVLQIASMLVSVAGSPATQEMQGVCAPDKLVDKVMMTYQLKNDGLLPVVYTISGAEVSRTSGELGPKSGSSVGMWVPVAGQATATVTFQRQDGQGQPKNLTLNGAVTVKPNSDCDPPNPDPQAPKGPSGIGGGSGDPHMRTFDQLAYDFQGVGDYVLTRSPDFEVHGRFEGMGSAVSLTNGMAAKVLGDQIEVYLNGNALQTYLNGTLLAGDYAAKLPGGGGLVATAQKVSLAHPDGSWATFDTGHTVQIQLAGARKEQAVGLLGNGDNNSQNDLKWPDGTLLNPANPDLYGAFRSGWNVRMYSPQAIFKHGSELWDAFFPKGVASLESLDPAKRAAAEELCLARGIVTQAVLRGCIYDVVITGDNRFVDYAFGFDPNVPRVLVNPAVALLETGQSRLFGAYVTGLANRNVSWTSTGGSISGNALATYLAPGTAGHYTIIATSTARPDLHGSATAVVVQAGQALWDGGGDGKSWSDPRNWVGDTLPKETDKVIIRNASTTPIEVNGTFRMLSLDSQGPLALPNGTQGLLLIQGGRISGMQTSSQGVGGTIETGGTLTFEGSNDLYHATLTATGEGKFINTGQITSFGNTALTGLFENRGKVKVVARVNGSATGGEFRNLSGSSVEFDGTGHFASNTLMVVNDGTIRCLASGSPGWNGLFSKFINRGLIESQSGVSNCRIYGREGSTLQGGQYEATAGNALSLEYVQLAGNLKGSGVGSVSLSGENTVQDGTRLEFSGSGLAFSGGIAGPGTLTNAGQLTTTWSHWSNLTLENLGTLRVVGRNASLNGQPNTTINNRASGVIEFPSGDSLEDSGSAVWQVNNWGVLHGLTAGQRPYLGMVYHDQGGTLDTGPGSMYVGLFPGSTLGGGTYRAGTGGTLELNADGTKAATILGKLSGNVPGTINLSGNLTIQNGAELAWTGQGANLGGPLLGTGTLVNSGILNAGYADSTAAVENRGTLRIGAALSAAAGARSTFTNAATGVLLLDWGRDLTRLDFTNLGRLKLTSSNAFLTGRDTVFNLGGTLDIAFPGSFQPGLGYPQTLIADYGQTTVKGTFAQLDGADFAPDRRWQISYSPTSVHLTVVSK